MLPPGPRPVSAPAKAFLMGEYAVLDGAPAWVAAVDVRATAYLAREEFGESTPAPSDIVAAVLATVRPWLEARGLGDAVVQHPIVDSGRFHRSGRKLGLGSSAAVAVAATGYTLRHEGYALTDASIRDAALGLATKAHARAQGGGSGADVAAAVLGGLVRFASGTPTRHNLPEGLVVGLVDSGTPASTPALVRRVREGQTRDRNGHHRATQLITRASALFAEALASSSSVACLRTVGEACGLHNRGLAGLEQICGAAILTPAIVAIVEAATEMGLAAKPSGAGGGDLVVVFASCQADLDRLAVRLLRRHKLALLGHVQIGAEGMREDPRPPVVSRIRGFYNLSVQPRRDALCRVTGIDPERFTPLDHGGIEVEEANHMVENVVGGMTLPLAVATNFRINGADVLVPMCVEESSVVAAASNAAKMARAGGGFSTHAEPPWMIAQVQLVGDTDPQPVVERIHGLRDELLRVSDAAHPRLVARGGGAREVEVRIVDARTVVVHILVDCRDAMGANLLNTVAEKVAPHLQRATGWRPLLRILSNLSDRRMSHVTARVPPTALAGRNGSGAEVVEGICAASQFAWCDPYRATTHNKGIMNGVDAVVLATGNDWRAIEAGAHAYAARDGQYRPLAAWKMAENGDLLGQMTLPTAVGVVGGLTRTHRAARLSLDILGSPSASELGQIIAAVGLASNLAALRALATEGISRGHMSLHARTLAYGAGAHGDEVDVLAQKLIDVGEIKADRASRLLRELREKP
ncbi:MAG: hydroxymethylglutaryl-CoA reductase, degradative [Nannocystaceae bacterium]